MDFWIILLSILIGMVFYLIYLVLKKYVFGGHFGGHDEND